MVLGGGAVSYERGTPAEPLAEEFTRLFRSQTIQGLAEGNGSQSSVDLTTSEGQTARYQGIFEPFREMLKFRCLICRNPSTSRRCCLT